MTPGAPLVSVVIPNHNYATYLGEALDSVLAQTHPHVELIVIDDGSTDGSAEVAARYGSRVQFIRQSNQGVAAARNHGARLGRGAYLAFLDADDRWKPTKLERQLALYAQDPQLGLTHCGVEEIDAAGHVLRQRLNGRSGWVARDLLRLERPVVLTGGSGAMVPRDVFEATGGFDERLSTSADWDWFFRLAIARRVGFVEEPLVQYRRHGANMHGNVHAMARDMRIGFEKAFGDPASPFLGIRRHCYGNLHMMLAGSFFFAHDYWHAAAHLTKSLVFAPERVSHLVGYLGRRRRGAVPGHGPLE